MKTIKKNLLIDKSRKVVLGGISEVIRSLPYFENPRFSKHGDYNDIETGLKDLAIGKQFLQNISLRIRILNLTAHSSLVRFNVMFTLLNKDFLSQLQYNFFIYPLIRSEMSSQAQVFKKRLEKWS